MKVIYTPEIFTNQRVGGISRYFHELIVRMQRDGQRPLVLAGLHRNDYLRTTRGVWGSYVPKVGKMRIPFNRMLGAMIIALQGPTVIHRTYYSPEVYAPRHRGVVTVYDMIHELLPDQLGVSSAQIDQAAREKRLACERADAIIAISHRTAEDLVTILGLDPGRITTVHLGLSFAPANMTAPEAGSGARAGLLYVGSRRFYKNFDALLMAYAASPTLRSRHPLVCFGGGPFSDAESQAIAAAGLTSHVSQRDGNDHSLAESYRRAAAFVFPSLYEGFGLPLLEAMSQGCPVLCARAGSLPEVAGPAAVYFNPTDPGDILRTLEETLSNPDKLVDLAQGGHQRAMEFSWDKCYQETLAVYRRVAAAR